MITVKWTMKEQKGYLDEEKNKLKRVGEADIEWICPKLTKCKEL
jgi:hypothetical protein